MSVGHVCWGCEGGIKQLIRQKLGWKKKREKERDSLIWVGEVK